MCVFVCVEWWRRFTSWKRLPFLALSRCCCYSSSNICRLFFNFHMFFVDLSANVYVRESGTIRSFLKLGCGHFYTGTIAPVTMYSMLLSYLYSVRQPNGNRARVKYLIDRTLVWIMEFGCPQPQVFSLVKFANRMNFRGFCCCRI